MMRWMMEDGITTPERVVTSGRRDVLHPFSFLAGFSCPAPLPTLLATPRQALIRQTNAVYCRLKSTALRFPSTAVFGPERVTPSARSGWETMMIGDNQASHQGYVNGTPSQRPRWVKGSSGKLRDVEGRTGTGVWRSLETGRRSIRTWTGTRTGTRYTVSDGHYSLLTSGPLS